MTSSAPKASQYANDCGAIRSRVDEIRNQLEISILIQYSSKEVKYLEEFKDNRGGHLMRECDTQSKLIRLRMEEY